MGSSSHKRRRSSPKPRRLPAISLLLSWATLANAVALSDFTPKITTLTSSCRIAYTTTIPGCKVSDFTNSAHTCSSSCLNGLVQINALVNQNCNTDDVDETSIVGLFLLGQAIQLLCNVEVVTTTTGLTQGGSGTPAPNPIPPNTFMTYSSTMTMSIAPPATTASTTSSTQVSSAISQTLSPTTQSRPMPSASDGMIGNTPIAPPSTSSTKSSSTDSKSAATSTTSMSPAAEESQRSGNVGSGGGSPFDNIDNSEAASLRALYGAFGTIAVALSMSALLTLG